MDSLAELKRAIATARRQLRRGRLEAVETALDRAAGLAELVAEAERASGARDADEAPARPGGEG